MNFPNFNLRAGRAGFQPGQRGDSENSAKTAGGGFGNLLAMNMKFSETARPLSVETANNAPGNYGQPANNSASPNVNLQEKGRVSSRSAGLLQAKSLVKDGQDTGRVFSPAALKLWRSENGYYRRYAEGEAPEIASARKKQPFVDETPPAVKENAPETPARIPEKINQLINRAAQALGLDADLVRAVVKVESNFNPKAVSPAGAMGLMQLMPGTAADLGVERPFEPYPNLLGGISYLKQMLDRYDQNLNQALAAYNWGPGNLDRFGGQGRMPAETRNYISAVNRHYQNFSGLMTVPRNPPQPANEPGDPNFEFWSGTTEELNVAAFLRADRE